MKAKSRIKHALGKLREISNKRVLVGAKSKRNAYLLDVHEFGKGHNPPRPMFSNSVPFIVEDIKVKFPVAVVDVLEGRVKADDAYNLLGDSIIATVRDGILQNSLGLQPLKPSTIKARARKKAAGKYIASDSDPLNETSVLANGFGYLVVDA